MTLILTADERALLAWMLLDRFSELMNSADVAVDPDVKAVYLRNAEITDQLRLRLLGA